MQSEPQRKQPTVYSPVASMLLVIALFMGSQIVGSVVFVGLLLLLPGHQGMSGAAIEQQVMDNPWLYLPLMMLIQSMALVGLSVVMRKKGLKWKEIGFNRFRSVYVLYAVAGYSAIFFVNILVTASLRVLLTGVDFEQSQNLGISSSIAGWQLIPLFITLVILPPLVEELLMRGFLFTSLRRQLPFGVSAVIVSVLFGLAHITQADSGLFWSGAISFFVLSMGLCWLREKTGSLWSGIGVHMLQNGIAFVLLYLLRVA